MKRPTLFSALLLALLCSLAIGCGGGGSPPGGGAPPGDGNGDPPSDPPQDDPAVRVRQNVAALTPQQIASLRQGVEAMKARPTSDPTSWLYQANIHGTYDSGDLPAWETCQHGSYFFLAWHRMYLYYFERILRAASGDDGLNLPYWNYSEPGQRALPVAFRDPANSGNSLFVGERAPGINSGAQLPASATTFDTAFAFTNFTSPNGSGSSFGGQQVSGPTHFSGVFGAIESQPHNIVHVLVGGQTGWMSDPNLAARDPIFYFHHANIDRLWDNWLALGGGRANPGDATWLNQSFQFFEADGSSVMLTGQEVVNAATQLGYRYDDASSETRPETEVTESETRGERTVLATVSGASVVLGREESTVTIERPESGTDPLASPEGELDLNVEGLQFYREGVYYEVYVNLPAGAEPDAEGDYYAGNVSYFGEELDEDEGALLSLRITDLVRTLRERGEWAGPLTVRFVPRGLQPPPGAEAVPEQGPVEVRFRRLTITSN